MAIISLGTVEILEGERKGKKLAHVYGPYSSSSSNVQDAERFALDWRKKQLPTKC
jgi:hypothetical protein